MAAKLGDVVVVAPDKPQSAQGHAVTMHKPLRLKKVDAGLGVETWECSGTPADTVKLAKDVILKDKKVDLVLSGINHGSNASINIIYSGTMSAATEGALEGYKSIGFSLENFSHDADFTAAKIYAEKIIKIALSSNDYDKFLLNVNIPNLPVESIKGIKICRQAKGKWVEEFVSAVDPMGIPYYWMTGKFENEEPEAEDTDLWALKNGFVSIVPSTFDLTDYKLIDKIHFFENEQF
ncbi:MAG: 5'/3'-nucleotidase SurE [Saprospiraceae bacterium]